MEASLQGASVKSQNCPSTCLHEDCESRPKFSPERLGQYVRVCVIIPSPGMGRVASSEILKLAGGLAGGVRMTTPFGNFGLDAKTALVCSP